MSIQKLIIKNISPQYILAAIVFLPPAKKQLLKRIRKITKYCFNFAGKVLGMLL